MFNFLRTSISAPNSFSNGQERRKQQRRKQLSFQLLEDRRLLAVTTAISGGDLIVTGTENADLIEVRMYGIELVIQHSTRDAGKLLSSGEYRFPSGAINQIRVNGNLGDDTLRVNFPTTFGSHSVTLDGGVGNDTLESYQAIVTMIGGEGNDTLKARGGTVTADYSTSSSGVEIDLLRSLVANDGLGSTDRIDGVNNVLGSSFDDMIRGNRSNNSIAAGPGNDTLIGLGGNDFLNGGDGANDIDGGDGDDTLLGGVGSDQMRGGAGNDRIIGGEGIDTIDFSFAVQSAGAEDLTGVDVDLLSGIASGEGNDIISGIENINGSDGKDIFNVKPGSLVRGGTGVDLYRVAGVEVQINPELGAPLPTSPEMVDLLQETFDRFRVSFVSTSISLPQGSQIALHNSFSRLAEEIVKTKPADLSLTNGVSLGLLENIKIGGATGKFWTDNVKQPFDNAVQVGGSIANRWATVFGDAVGRKLANFATNISNAVSGLAEGIGNAVSDFTERLGDLGNPLTLKFYGKFIESVALFGRDVLGSAITCGLGVAIDAIGDIRGEVFGRSLNAEEKSLADNVFGGKLKTWKIRIVEDENLIGTFGGTRPYVNGNTVFLSPSSIFGPELADLRMKVVGGINYKIDTSPLGPLTIATFVHELTHIYQKQEFQSPTCKAIGELASPQPETIDIRSSASFVNNILGGPPPVLPPDPRYDFILGATTTWDSLGDRTEPQAQLVEQTFLFLEAVNALQAAEERSLANGIKLSEEILKTDPNTIPGGPQGLWDLFYNRDAAKLIAKEASSATQIDSQTQFNGFPKTIGDLRRDYPAWRDHFRIMISKGFFGLQTGNFRLNAPLSLTAVVNEAGPHTVGAQQTPVVSDLLTLPQLNSVVDEAERRWEAVIGTDIDLSGVNFSIDDLPSTLLGEAYGNTIIVDESAVNHGWFIDSSLASERIAGLSGGELQLPDFSGTDGDNRFDLLTVVMHEIGHFLGFDHNSSTPVMQSPLPPGVRRLATGVVSSNYSSLAVKPLADNVVQQLHADLTPGVRISRLDLVNGVIVFTGSVFDDALVLGEAGGLLTHNATIGIFASNTDVDPGPGVSTFPLATATSIVVDMGEGDDTVNAAEIILTPVTLYGGLGNDALTGTSAPTPQGDHIEGGEGDDVLAGLAGDDFLSGGDGRDQLLGGVGNDVLLGGLDQDIIVGGTGVDAVDGGGGEDVFVFSSASGAITVNSILNNVAVFAAGGSNTGLAGAANIESLIVQTLNGGPSAFAIGDLTGTPVKSVGVDLATGLTAGSVLTVAGSNDSDAMSVSNSTRFGAVVPAVSTNWGQVGFLPGVGSRLVVDSRGGDDQILLQGNPTFGATQVELNGGAGNDRIDISQFIGAPIIVAGGNGNDVIVGRNFADQISGGLDDDVLLFLGTSANDVISLNQTAPVTLNFGLNAGAPAVITMTPDIELIRVEAGSGADVIGVTAADLLATIPVEIDGGPGNASDRLVVQDAGTGDLVLVREGKDGASGRVTTGSGLLPRQEITYSHVESTEYTQADGGDGLSRVVILKPDRFENNNQRTSASTLQGAPTLEPALSIDPGDGTGIPLPPPFNQPTGDQDWFRFQASKTGAFRLAIDFTAIASVGTRPGLPDNGQLAIEIRDANGNLIAPNAKSPANARDISVEAGQTVFVRVIGVDANSDGVNEAVNAYDLRVSEVVDHSVAKLGTWSGGSVYIDLNRDGNFNASSDNAALNDVAFTLGLPTDFIFNGVFFNTTVSGTDFVFDKLGAYGKVNGAFRFLLDQNNNGVPDVNIPVPNGVPGIPVAGNFNNNPLDGDEIGLFTGTNWLLDLDRDFAFNSPGETIPTTIFGLPFVGDFNGDGFDDLGTYNPTTNTFFVSISPATGPDANLTYSFRLGNGAPFIGTRERPVAADMNRDGVDDLGLWAPDRSGLTPDKEAEWYFIVSIAGAPLQTRVVKDLTTGRDVINFRPTPFGTDLFYQFGDEYALPLVGNFDPPGAPTTATTEVTTPDPILPSVANRLGSVTGLEDGWLSPINLDSIFTGDGTLRYAVQSNSLGSVLDASASGSILSLVPRANAIGSGQIVVLATDANGNQVTDTLTFTISQVNDAPIVVTQPQVVALQEDQQAVEIRLSDYFRDVDGETLRFTVGQSQNVPSWLELQTIDDRLRIMPRTNQSGEGTVTITATDADGATARVDLSITLAAVNDPPIAVSLTTSIQLGEDQATQSVDLQRYFADVDDRVLSYRIASTGNGGVIDAGLVGQELRLTPRPNATGNATVVVEAIDSTGATASTSFVFNVLPTNDAPSIINALPQQILTEDGSASSINLDQYFADVDGDDLVYTLETPNSLAGIIDANISGSILTLTPRANASGAGEITVAATDSGGNQVTSTLAVTITAVNDSPVAVNPVTSLQLIEDQATHSLSLSAFFHDIDDNILSYRIASTGNGGAIDASVVGQELRLTPRPNATGNATVVVEAVDSTGATASTSFVFNVLPTNDAPSAINPLPQQIFTEDGSASSINLDQYFADVDGDDLVYTLETPNSLAGILDANITGAILTLTPRANASGTGEITVVTTDSGSNQVTNTLSVTITAVNDSPVAVNAVNSRQLMEDQATHSLSLSAFFHDIDDNILSYRIASTGNGGVVNATVLGQQLQLTPRRDATGSEMVVIEAWDSSGATASTYFAIQVIPTNDAPSVVNPLPQQVFVEDGPAASINLNHYFADPDGDSLRFSVQEDNQSRIASIVEQDGILTIRPLANLHGERTFTITGTDPAGGIARSTLQIVILSQNDAPVFTSTVASPTIRSEGEVRTVPLSSAFTDPDGDSLNYRITSLSNPSLGSASLADGELLVSGVAGQSGSLTVSVIAADSFGSAAMGHFNFNIDIPSTPVPAIASTIENTVLTPEDDRTLWDVAQISETQNTYASAPAGSHAVVAIETESTEDVSPPSVVTTNQTPDASTNDDVLEPTNERSQTETVAKWLHNIAHPTDVNGDGQVVALDVLIVINALVAEYNPELLPPSWQATTGMAVDVSGNGTLEALDALLVINEIYRLNHLSTNATSNTSESQAVSVAAAPVAQPLVAQEETQNDPEPEVVIIEESKFKIQPVVSSKETVSPVSAIDSVFTEMATDDETDASAVFDEPAVTAKRFLFRSFLAR